MSSPGLSTPQGPPAPGAQQTPPAPSDIRDSARKIILLPEIFVITIERADFDLFIMNLFIKLFEPSSVLV